MSGQHQYKPNGQMAIERSGSSHSSFLSHIYLDPNCVIPESPTISITSTHDLAAGATHIVESPITSGSTWEERELSRIQSNDSGEYEDLDDPQICIQSTHYSTIGGGTKPLRVKKKKGVTAVKVGSKTKKRISIPHSPVPQYSRSFTTQSTSPRQFGYTGIKPKRNPSSNSGKSNLSRTYANISSIFLNLPSDSPTEKMGTMKGRIGNSTRFSDSSLHLGLGKFTTYDPISPGPSPPTSPLPSPNKRNFVSTSTATTGEYMKKPLPHPPSPLTPSRAPRKAAALLGASVPIGSAQSRKGGGGKMHGLNTKHFRPLPHSTLTEIEKFFGDVPNKNKKPNTPVNGSKTKSKSTSGVGGMDERGMGDRNVGSGETVKYKSEDGSMWLDVEEEQEFAWLLSEIFALIPQPLPDLTLAKVKSNETTGSQEEENKWEMENFTSILSLPKPKAQPNNKSKTGKKTKVTSDNSFLDLGLDTPKLHRNNMNINPWTNTSTPSHKRSLSNPTSPSSTIPKLSISSPMPALIPPPRISSKAGPSSLPNSTTCYMDQVHWSVSAAEFGSGSGSGSGSDSEGSTSSSGFNGSPPRIKNRPPPLTLKRIKPSSKLPILTATTPSNNNNNQHQNDNAVPVVNRSKSQAIIPSDRERYKIPSDQSRIAKKYEAPSTPFVRPRIAPRPNPSEVIPPLPISIGQSQEQEQEPMSFFEPATPTEPKSKPITNANLIGSGNKEKKSWLKRVVRRPLKV